MHLEINLLFALFALVDGRGERNEEGKLVQLCSFLDSIGKKHFCVNGNNGTNGTCHDVFWVLKWHTTGTHRHTHKSTDCKPIALADLAEMKMKINFTFL